MRLFLSFIHIQFYFHNPRTHQERRRFKGTPSDSDINFDSSGGVFSNEIIRSSEEDLNDENTERIEDGDGSSSVDPALTHSDPSFGTFHNFEANLPTEMLLISCGNLSIKSQKVKCYPKPDELNPCEDVLGSNWLRTSVWIVVSFTVFGNISVLVVILSSRWVGLSISHSSLMNCNLT